VTAHRCLATAWAAVALLLTGAPVASAHGLVIRQDLGVPDWLFGWGAAIVLVVTFVALGVLWQTPRLEPAPWRPLPERLSRVLTHPALERVAGGIGLLLLCLVVWSGLRGSQTPTENLAPTFVYIVFWLGLVPVSAVFGDVFRAFNPWRAGARTVSWLASALAHEPLPAPFRYPDRLGRWPAAVGLVAFALLELVVPGGDVPYNVALAAAVYSFATWAGMALYGIESWTDRGEAFSVYFGMFARLSVFERRGGRLGIRPPLSGLSALEPLPGTVGLLAVMIGTVSFDGLSAGKAWQELAGNLRDGPLGALDANVALILVWGIGLFAAVAVVWVLYAVAAAGARRVRGGRRGPGQAFVHSLVPIALAYVGAHYVSLLLLQGQAVGALVSDPLGTGTNLLGTAEWGIDYAFLSFTVLWYLQVAFVVGGHLAGVVLAHDRALVVYDEPRQALRSQYWMLGVMIAFTTLALWLLSEASKG
jgi:hypothetical protein